MKTFNSTACFIVMLLVTFVAKPSFAQQAQLPATINQMTKDIYIADATILVTTDVLGDAAVAGGNILIANSVAEDVLAAGGTINITAKVGDDIRAAGGSIAIAGDVGDDVIAAGGTVVLDSASTVGGRAWLVGDSVTIAGNIAHGLKAAGETIILTGTIGGDVELHAKSIEIKPSAVIKGNLNYSAPIEANIDKDASITGEVNHKEVAFEGFGTKGSEFTNSFLFYLSLTASAIVLFLLFPLRSILVVKQLRSSPLKSSCIGLIALFSSPFIALMLLVSVIGVPIGLVVLALYSVVLVIGLLIGIIWVGDFGFRKMGKEPMESKYTRAWSIASGAITLFIVDWVPFIGGWFFFITLLLGVGGVTQYFYQLYGNRDKGLLNVTAPTK